MTTSELIHAYLAARRAHGVKLGSGERALCQFARQTGDRPLAEVTRKDVAQFLHGRGLSATWKTKYGLLAGLYRFAMARGHVAASVLPEQRPRLPPPLTPYIYSSDELQRLLNASVALESPRNPLQALTYRTLLLLLYGAGLRVSEAIGLTLGDVDLRERVLTIRETKFYKSRLVPIGRRLAAALSMYIEQRDSLPRPQGDRSAFLSARGGQGLTYKRAYEHFQRVRSSAGIVCPPGGRRPPRLHDIRHTAATHRVLAWYREGKDVQQLLPRLATYLGHVSIASTQQYVQLTPELLHEASLRFAAYAQVDAEEEINHA
ncbi:MAG: tyrosine-type recombinase/integrase [Chloroflexota bacterium]|nr:tyrosine-type recombinase/integrase [Chloroflexota bacterium]